MVSRQELSVAGKMVLMKQKETELSHRQPKTRFQASLGSVSNIPERKPLNAHDSETDRN